MTGKGDDLIRGALAGAGGCLLLGLSDRIERAALGRRPVYAPERVAARLLGRRSGADGLAGVMRWGYGVGLGVLQALPARPRRFSWTAALGLAGAVFGFELWAMPRVGATPPLRRWPRREIATLGAHTVVFGLATEAARAALLRARRER